MAEDWHALLTLNSKNMRSEDPSVQYVQDKSRNLLIQLDAGLTMNSAIMSGSADSSVQLLTENIIVVSLPKASCRIIKLVGNQDQDKKFVIQSDYHPVRVRISGCEHLQPAREDWPTDSKSAMWKSESSSSHPMVAILVQIHKKPQWKSLLVTVVNESNSIANRSVKLILNENLRVKTCNVALSAKEN
jgi:hypothetical protein